MANERLKRIVGDNVRRFRDKSKFSQAGLAELVDRDSSCIAHIEQAGQLPSMKLLLRLSEVFAVSTDAILKPEGSALHLHSIISMLNSQSDEALSHLEPIIRAWLYEYGDPKPLPQETRKPKKSKKYKKKGVSAVDTEAEDVP